EQVVPYTNKTFHWAAIEWLVASDQPIQALKHPKFKEMINIAAHATNGVKVPGRKLMRAEIIQTFKDHLTKLKAWLNVSTCLR
ncbi:hypothetical protein B0F90DRAFT_1655017, partial [Multifurca ochricompacta]